MIRPDARAVTSLLNVDYKIASEAIAIANRVIKVLPNLISMTQTGYVKGRLMADAVRVVNDVMEYCNARNKKGIMLMIDFRKAFDRMIPLAGNFL